MRNARSAAAVPVAVLLGVLCGCSGSPSPDPPAPDSPGTTAPRTTSPSAQPEPTTPQTSEPEEPAAVAAKHFDERRALAVVRHLALDVGPRHGTSPQFRRAADWAADRLERLGYEVSRQRFDAPGGISWGIPVPAGRSQNVVATPERFDPGRPHLVVGAHLDTVPQAPGAEDNASGVGVLLAAAEAAAERRTRLPVVWVAFGAEEPRGPSDDDHHYGSQHYVASMTRAERSGLRAMLAIDRVGVGSVVPVGSAGAGDPVQRSLLAAGRRAGVATLAVAGSSSSDHWSFVRNGLPGARLGSTPYAAYHSADDLPGVVDPAQLRRTGRLLLEWLAPQGAR